MLSLKAASLASVFLMSSVGILDRTWLPSYIVSMWPLRKTLRFPGPVGFNVSSGDEITHGVWLN